MIFTFVRRLALIVASSAFCVSAVAQYPQFAQREEPIPFGTPGPMVSEESLQAAGPTAAAYHLSLDEAKCRVLQNNVVMEMATAQVAAKGHALDAARKDYLPKLLNSFSYFHFDSDLGTVLTTPGIFNPATTVAVPVIEQDSTIYTAAAVQPITPLLKVREAVAIGQADLNSAAAQRELARIELVKGVEQLYFGIRAAQQTQVGLEGALAAAKQSAAAAPSASTQIVVIEVQQGILAANNQVATLSEQLNGLIGLPLPTQLQLDDMPVPNLPYGTIDDAVGAAVSANPKVEDARQQVDKAEAAVRLVKADYVPSVMAYGFYVNQNATPTIQEDFTGVGFSANYVLEWGKKIDTTRSQFATLVLARANLQKTIDDTRVAAAKAYHEAVRSQQALDYARQLAKLSSEVPLPADPFQLKSVLKDRLDLGLAAVKAEAEYGVAVAELKSVTGCVR
jgi:outer membrane protein